MKNKSKLFLVPALTLCLYAADEPRFDYRVLATSKTSTMEKEMNEAASAGFSFAGVMGGETAVGSKEVTTYDLLRHKSVLISEAAARKLSEGLAL